ncbi:conjugative transfer signal peptidase TraF [Rhizobacter sp. Root1221]|uniref:conjugative transfer signal peptidase TraF n=1 Tax=Rhizobacter sp. Root1221 TaxID=1736433 RepID=UPI0006FF671E|nr:conjugative transfer signal peptidase TraF [Rhizobacter sp. Root1221]KQW02858.1 conjugal transfer protein TraF [Rhizobacter sp. Root1221]
MSAAIAARPAGVLSWWAGGARSLGQDFRRRWWLYGLIAAIWGLALLRLFVPHVPVLPVMFNWTPSLPYSIVYVDYWHGPLQRGDLVVYLFTGEAAQLDYPGLGDQAFFKRVAGVPGDSVAVVGRDVFVNGVAVGRAKTHAFDRRPLQPIAPIVIPPGFLYVQGTSPDSFDSRYRSSGLVAVRNVRATVNPIF